MSEPIVPNMEQPVAAPSSIMLKRFLKLYAFGVLVPWGIVPPFAFVAFVCTTPILVLGSLVIWMWTPQIVARPAIWTASFAVLAVPFAFAANYLVVSTVQGIPSVMPVILGWYFYVWNTLSPLKIVVEPDPSATQASPG